MNEREAREIVANSTGMGIAIHPEAQHWTYAKGYLEGLAAGRDKGFVVFDGKAYPPEVVFRALTSYDSNQKTTQALLEALENLYSFPGVKGSSGLVLHLLPATIFRLPQVLCKSCHKKKTGSENTIRRKSWPTKQKRKSASRPG